MADSSKEHGKGRLPGVDYTLCADDIDVSRINDLLSGFRAVSCYDLMSFFSDKLQQCSDDEYPRLKLLVGLTSMMLHPDHSEPYQRRMVDFCGKTSLSPEDLLPEQICELRSMVSEIDNPGLRARISDLVWFKSRRHTCMAELAVSSYCDCIDRIGKGELQFSGSGNSSCDEHISDLPRRAARICSVKRWNLESSDRLIQTISDAVDLAYGKGSLVDFSRMADIVLVHGQDIKPNYERLANQYFSKINGSDERIVLSARVEMWQSAKRCFEMAGDDEQHKEMAEQCSINAMSVYVNVAENATSDLQAAMQLRMALKVRGRGRSFVKYRAGVNSKLVKHMKEASGEMDDLIMQYDFKEEAMQARKMLRNKDLGYALQQLFTDKENLEPASMTDEAAAQKSSSVLIDTVTNFYTDDRYLLIENEQASKNNGNTDGKQMYDLSRSRCISRFSLVAEHIAPWRKAIAEKFELSENVLTEHKGEKSVLTEECVDEVILGAMHFLNGNYFESLLILTLYLENVLRQCLVYSGLDVAYIDDEENPREVTLSSMLDRGQEYRSVLEGMFGEGRILELELLFNFEQGPNLRNRVAHGRVMKFQCKGYNEIYASWFILTLVKFGSRDAEKGKQSCRPSRQRSIFKWVLTFMRSKISKFFNGLKGYTQ